MLELSKRGRTEAIVYFASIQKQPDRWCQLLWLGVEVTFWLAHVWRYLQDVKCSKSQIPYYVYRLTSLKICRSVTGTMKLPLWKLEWVRCFVVRRGVEQDGKGLVFSASDLLWCLCEHSDPKLSWRKLQVCASKHPQVPRKLSLFQGYFLELDTVPVNASDEHRILWVSSSKACFHLFWEIASSRIPFAVCILPLKMSSPFTEALKKACLNPDILIPPKPWVGIFLGWSMHQKIRCFGPGRRRWSLNTCRC